MKKKIYLFIFVVFILNLFYVLISKSIGMLIYEVITLVIAYFCIYPNKFFLCISNAKNYIKSRRSVSNNNIDIETKNHRDISKGHEKEGNTKKIDETINKGDNNTLII